jgi:putative membrane protein insertion efficiency factor
MEESDRLLHTAALAVVRRRLIALLTLVALLVVVDLQRAPTDQVMTRAAVGGIHLYQATLARVYARAGLQCRFTPTCSHYGEVCIRQFGIARGSFLALKRVLKCGPWTPAGTIDLPPSVGANIGI